MKAKLFGIFAAVTAGFAGFVSAQDLVIQSVDVPDTELIPGGTATITVTVGVPGDPETDPGLAGGAGFVVEGTVAGFPASPYRSAPFTEAIEAGGSGTLTINVPIPDSVANGSYAVSIDLDPDDVVAEDDEGNNSLAFAGNLTVEAFANLEITSVEIRNTEVYPGSSLIFRVVYTNSGDRAAEASQLSVSLTAPEGGTSAPLFSLENLAPIAVGASVTFDFTSDNPVPLDNPNGSYTVDLVIDSGGAVDEGENEGDNDATAGFSIATLSNLRITDLVFDAGEWEAGDPVRFTVNYTNQEFSGTRRTLRVTSQSEELYYLEVVLSTDSVFGNEDDFLLHRRPILGHPFPGARQYDPFSVVGDPYSSIATTNLVPGDRVAYSWTQAMPDNFSGDYFVMAKIDVDENVDEYVEDDRLRNGDNVWYTLETAQISIRESPRPDPTTERISLKTDGTEGDSLSDEPDVSRDGRFVVFSSLARLDPTDTNDVYDVYLRDQYTGEVTLITASLGSFGIVGDSRYPSISADGGHVAFQSDSEQLDPGDSNGQTDIYLWERATGILRRISQGLNGSPANGPSSQVSISADGTRLVYASLADNLTSESVSLNRSHIYATDTGTRSTILLSANGGVEGSGDSFSPAISSDGNFVTFVSRSNNILAGVSGEQVYRVGFGGSGMQLVSQTTGGVQGDGRSYQPDLSADGSVVVFASEATNLDSVVPDSNGVADIFIRSVAGGTTLRILGSGGAQPNSPDSGIGPGALGSLDPSISEDGKRIIFRSQSDNLLPEFVRRSDGTDFNLPAYGFSGYSPFADNPATDVIVGYSDLPVPHPFGNLPSSDVYLFDMDRPDSLEMVTRNTFGYPRNSWIQNNEPTIGSSRNAVISGDGRYVVFSHDGRGSNGFSHGRTNRISPDANEVRDVFVRDLKTLDLFDLNSPPSVFWRMPSEGTNLSVQQGYRFQVEAMDNNGYITSVEYFANGESIGQGHPGDFSFYWVPEELGVFLLQAVATDNDGLRRASSFRTVSVLGGTAPSVSITSPLNGETLPVGESFVVSASASDSDGIVQSVDFYLNGVFQASDTTAPFVYTTTLPNPGQYEFVAVATDDAGLSGYSSPVQLEVTDGLAPQISILHPAENGNIKVGQATELQATVSDPSSAINQVEFYVNGVYVDDAVNVGGIWRADYLPNSTGTVAIKVVATDTNGAYYSSESRIANVVSGQSPTVSIVSPISGAEYGPGSSVDVDVSAYDSDGLVASVEFYLNGVLMGTSTVAPYQRSMVLPSVGSYEIHVVATDTDGLSTQSPKVQVTAVNNAGQAPTVSITRPLDAAQFLPGTFVEVESTALDLDGLISQVEYFLNGVSVGSSTIAPYAVDVFLPSTGSYELMAVATDTAGISSPADRITLVGTEDAGTRPTVEILAPFGDMTFLPGTNVPVQVNAADPDGLIARVDFYLNNVLIGSSSVAPYRTDLLLPSSGNYILEVIAIDNDNLRSDADSVNLTAGLIDETVPRVVINHPFPLGAGDIFNDVSTPSAVFLNAEAIDKDGTIEAVRFYVNNQLLGESDGRLGDIYSLFLDPNAPGSYVITAEAEDNDGKIGQSTSIFLDVGPLQSPMPVARIREPSYPSSPANRPVEFFVEANAGLNSIDRVDLYADGVLVGSSLESVPNVEDLYSFTWTPTIPGDYVLRARVVQIDPGGQTFDNWKITDPVNFTVDNPQPVEENILVDLTNPVEGSRHTVLNPISLQADAQDVTGNIAVVHFLVDGVIVASDNSYPYSASYVPQSPGIYILSTRAENSFGEQGSSEQIPITVDPSQEVDVSIRYPVDGSTISIGQPVLITADGQSTGGGNLEMRFYANGRLISTDNTYPYNTLWLPESTGAFSIRVEGFETGIGGVATSDEISLNVVGSQDPVISWVSPGETPPTAGSDVLLEVEGTDPDGSVREVQFFVNGQPLANPDTAVPFTAFWQPGSAGTYNLSVAAIDDSGNQVVNSRQITVNPPIGIVPSVTLSVTASGNITPGSRVVARANVFDDTPDDVTVTFFMNGSQVGPADTTAPYSVIFSPEIAVGSSYSIAAVALDGDGNSRVSELSPLYISDVPTDQPSIEIVTPSSGDQLTIGSRAPIRMDVGGGAAGDIRAMVFYVDGVEIGRDTTAPYSFDWIPEQLGEVQLTVASLLSTKNFDHDLNPETPFVAVTPVNIASPVDLVVNPKQGILPSISLDVLPANTGLAIGSKVMLYADAQDLDGNVASVTFFLDGEPIGTDTEVPFSQTLTTTAEGIFFLNAVATDNEGNVVTSSYTNLEVTSRVVPTTPVVNLTVPSSGQEGSLISLRGSTQGFVNGPDGIVFHVNGQAVGTANAVPYAFPWLANLSGELSFFNTAMYTLEDGSIICSVSDIQTLDLVENLAPVIGVVQFSYPRMDDPNKPNALVGETLTFTIPVTDTGPVETVELFRDGEVVATLVSGNSPYTMEDVPPGAGDYQYSVVVTDKGGLQAQSANLPVSVVQGGGGGGETNLPVISSFTNSTSDNTSLTDVPVIFTVEATDERGIDRVDIFANGVNIGEAVGNPFRLSYLPVMEGQFIFYAEVTNLDGLAVRSEDVIVSVRTPDPLAENRDFVYQTYLDLLFRTPTQAELSDLSGRLDSGDLSRGRFITGITDPAKVDQGQEYDLVRGSMMARYFSEGDWPSRDTLETDLAVARDGGLEALMEGLLPTLQATYLAYVSEDPLVPSNLEITRIPRPEDSPEKIDHFMRYLFQIKYKTEITDAQLDWGRLQYQFSPNAENFLKDFILDVRIEAVNNGYWSTIIGFNFKDEAPDLSIVEEADAVALLINLLRIQPAMDELEALASELRIVQVDLVLADPRYAERFDTVFPALSAGNDGWSKSEWFGWFNTDQAPWMYHLELGWVYVETRGQSTNSLWYYDLRSGWNWTNAGLYPVLFENTSGLWLMGIRTMYLETHDRWFYDLMNDEWVAR